MDVSSLTLPMNCVSKVLEYIFLWPLGPVMSCVLLVGANSPPNHRYWIVVVHTKCPLLNQMVAFTASVEPALGILPRLHTRSWGNSWLSPQTVTFWTTEESNKRWKQLQIICVWTEKFSNPCPWVGQGQKLNFPMSESLTSCNFQDDPRSSSITCSANIYW